MNPSYKACLQAASLLNSVAQGHLRKGVPFDVGRSMLKIIRGALSECVMSEHASLMKILVTLARSMLAYFAEKYTGLQLENPGRKCPLTADLLEAEGSPSSSTPSSRFKTHGSQMQLSKITNGTCIRNRCKDADNNET